MNAGVTLQPNTIVTLATTGTLVLVESASVTGCRVVALPDQPMSHDDDRIFTPGRLRPVVVSAFVDGDPFPIEQLTEHNRAFIAALAALRAQHGGDYVVPPSEEHEMAKKAAKVAAKKTAKKSTKPAAKPAALTGRTSAGKGTSMDVTPKTEPAAAPAAKPAKPAKSEPVYELTGEFLKEDGRFAPGKLGHQVFEGIRAVKRGTVGDIVAATEKVEGFESKTDHRVVVRHFLLRLIEMGVVRIVPTE